MDKRWGKVNWGDKGTRVRTSAANWRQPLAWDRAAKEAGERHRVFCASLADVFEDRDELRPWRAELRKLIESTPNLDWLLLTKRPENACALIGSSIALEERGGDDATRTGDRWFESNPRVWMGASIEDQKSAEERVPALTRIPSAVRFLSCEPLLGPLLLEWMDKEPSFPLNGDIHWVIAGGESGHGARPMHPDWVRWLRDQCVAAGVPFFFKQWGEWKPISDMPESEMAALYVSNRIADEGQRQCDIDEVYGRRCRVPTEAIRFDGVHGPVGSTGFSTIDGHLTYQTFRVGKSAAGRLLDGREWNEFPSRGSPPAPRRPAKSGAKAPAGVK